MLYHSSEGLDPPPDLIPGLCLHVLVLSYRLFTDLAEGI